MPYLATRLGLAYKANQVIDLDVFSKEFGEDVFEIDVFQNVINDLCSRGFLSVCGLRKYLPTAIGEHFHEEIISMLIHKKLLSV